MTPALGPLALRTRLRSDVRAADFLRPMGAFIDCRAAPRCSRGPLLSDKVEGSGCTGVHPYWGRGFVSRPAPEGGCLPQLFRGGLMILISFSRAKGPGLKIFCSSVNHLLPGCVIIAKDTQSERNVIMIGLLFDEE